MVENDKLIEAAVLLKEHCAGIDFCTGCPFGEKAFCAIGGGAPLEWDVRTEAES